MVWRNPSAPGSISEYFFSGRIRILRVVTTNRRKKIVHWDTLGTQVNTMILSRQQCKELLRSPRTPLQRWAFTEERHVDTQGVTGAVAMAFSNSVGVNPQTGAPFNKHDRKNELRDFSFRDFKTVIAKGGRFTDVKLLDYAGPEMVSKLFARLSALPNLTEGAFRTAWAENNISAGIGNYLDAIMKRIFNTDPKLRDEVGAIPVAAKALCSMFSNTDIEPVAGGVLVAEYEGVLSGHCPKCSAKYPHRPYRFLTEIDLVGFNAVEKTCVLIELKTYKNAVIPQQVIEKYNLQAWVSWCLFSMTYPRLMPVTRAIVVVVSPVVQTIQFFNVRPPRVRKKLINLFPFLGRMCPTGYQMLTPQLASPLIRSPFKVCVIADKKTAKAFSQSTERKPTAPRKPLTDEQKERRKLRRAELARERKEAALKKKGEGAAK
uniref:Core protein n=1 Tax=Latid herpesvirus 1 TaxID=3096545 RepID=A0AB33V6U1_9VIRU